MIYAAHPLDDRLDSVGPTYPCANESARLAFRRGVVPWFGYLCHVDDVTPDRRREPVPPVFTLTKFVASRLISWSVTAAPESLRMGDYSLT